MRVYRDIYDDNGTFVRTDAVFDIMKATYTGQDMGKRMITATILFPTPIDFQLGDYVQLSMQSLYRNGSHGSVESEKFYIYTEPQCKKTARPMITGDAFETTVVFYPRQYELSGIQMRDFIQQDANADKIIYTGFDNVTFYGGAHELLRRCKACLDQYYKGANEWNYVLDDSLDEDTNNALERYSFSFQGNSVMEALMKLNDKDFINTTFYINGRTIYVGRRRPFLCAVNASGDITDTPLELMYGKTSHLPIDKTYGGLFDITKSVSEEVPITKLFAYGASRNLNRYYCADRIASGRFVNRLMLPSFSDDGETDYIISEDGVKKYGICEGSKTFDEIYPSLRYMTYADIRGIKYCIKIKTSGLSSDQFIDGKMDHDNSRSTLPLARVQCYKVTPCAGSGDGTVGVNKLVECAPPENLVIFIHATGKTVKVVLFGGATNAEAIAKQKAHDVKIPTTDGLTPAQDNSNVIPGSCFCVHDVGFKESDPSKVYTPADRADWFNAEFRRYKDTDSLYADSIEQQTAELHRIEYVDTFWLTDLYVMEYQNGTAMYDNQRSFRRDGYSAWAWPRLNNQSIYADSLPVNEIVGVEPIVIADTSDNVNAGRQQHWDIYLRDIGFAIDEQNDFGEMVFVFNTPVVSMLDGLLAGREFTIDGGENLNDFQERVVCAYNEDGTVNNDFFFPGDSNDEGSPRSAFLNGAIWRVRLNRNDQDSELSSVGLVIPNVDIQAKAGDHMVLLDIYMPDIYIRAAEQRLEREARSFLEKNDKGNVKYAINFDKVRFNQIQNYALQMREGVMLRMVDEDLNISSTNTSRMIVDHEANPLLSAVPLYSVETITSTEKKTSAYTYYKKNDERNPKLSEVATMESMGTERTGYIKVAFNIPKTQALATYAGESDTDGSEFDVIYNNVSITFDNFKCTDIQDRYHIEFQCSVGSFGGTYDTDGITLGVTIAEHVVHTESHKVSEEMVPAICRDYVNFKAGKYYEVVMDVEEYVNGSDKALFIPTGTHANGTEANDQIFLTTSPSDITTRYKVNGYLKTFKKTVDTGGNISRKRYMYSFYLPDSFTEGTGYYVSLLYFSAAALGDIANIRMVSVTEKDMDAQGNVVNYVDFMAASVTINIEDNSRPADISGMSDEMRERLMERQPEPIYEIQATIEEQTKASTWATLRNDLEKTKIETETNKKTYEMLAQAARQNYQGLLNLKNNIFDPDGTCTDVFLQVMMLQVGADSMNYQLDYTHTSPTGVPSNYSVGGRDVQQGTYDWFRVKDDDVLHHFVYTQGAGNQGTWQIPGNFGATLAPETDGEGNTVWPTYYVCIRCKKDTINNLNEPAWICSKYQYAVNQDTDPETGQQSASIADYWYFNWGILTADSNGNYTLTETRGNAYMYGDNIVAGKISTIAGNSYFDLTHGNFVLSQGTEANASLSYIDGVLTIKGVNDPNDATSILSRLNLLDEIGGENLYSGEDPISISSFPNYYDYDIELKDGVKYILTVGEINGNAYGLDVYEKVNGTYTKLGELVNGGTIGTMQHYENKSLKFEGHGGTMSISIRSSGAQYYYELSKIMLQIGTKATSYQEYVKHLSDAIKGTTEIVGGLTMTNLLLLKDEFDDVNAGMSGLNDDNPTGEFGDGTFSEGVAMFAGGTYENALAQAMGLYSQLQQLIPVLITKTGIHSKIGPFEVISDTAVAVTSASGKKIIIDSEKGITMMDEDGNVKFELLMDDISLSDLTTYRGRFNVPEPSFDVVSTNATDYPLGIIRDACNLIGSVPSQGNYRLDFVNFTLGLTIECFKYQTRRGRSAVVNRKLFEDVPIKYRVYLKNISTSQKYYIIGSASSMEQATVPAAVSGMSVYIYLATPSTQSVTISSLPAGSYVLGAEVWTEYDFEEAGYILGGKHVYKFLAGGSPELVALDGADFSGKVAIGTNGLVVAAGNSTFMSAMTNKSSGKMDIRMLGIPNYQDGTTRNTGQVYSGAGGVLYVET